MEEGSGEGLLKKAKQLELTARMMMERELETPVTQPLTPEAREDAMKVGKEVWTESMRLLGDKDEVVRVDPQGIKGNLIIAGKRAVDKTIFRGADLGISRYTFEYHPEAQSRDSTQELWHFYPDHVLKTIRHESEAYSGEPLPPKGLATKKVEADRDDLSALLSDIKGSAEFKAR